jgi:hypothetical protein
MEETKQWMSVRNMEKYQHYKINKPRWIKLYETLWHEIEFWRLKDVSKAHLIGIFVLCSQHNNLVPFDTVWITQAINATDPIDWEALLESGYIVVNEGEKEKLYKTYRTPLEKRSNRVEKRREEESRGNKNRDVNMANIERDISQSKSYNTDKELADSTLFTRECII